MIYNIMDIINKDYFKKYMKYKNKYLKLKKLIGGDETIDDDFINFVNSVQGLEFIKCALYIVEYNITTKEYRNKLYILNNVRFYLDIECGINIIGIINKDDKEVEFNYYNFIKENKTDCSDKYIYFEEGKKIKNIPICVINKNIYDSILSNKGYNGITTECFTSQSRHVYFNINNTNDGSSNYKLHIVCKHDKITKTILEFLKYIHLHTFTSILSCVNKFKIPFLSLFQVIDKTEQDEGFQKNYEYDLCSGCSNIIIYFNTNRNDHINRFIYHLKTYWIENGFDDEFSNPINNLNFNQRLTKTIYIAYTSDTAYKADDYINKITDNFTITNQLQIEKNEICKAILDDDKKNEINTCLDNKYNFTIDDLCIDDITTKPNFYVKKDHDITQIESDEYPRCHTLL